MSRRQRRAARSDSERAALAERIRQARLDAGLSVEGLAERAGITTEAVGRYERGEALPGTATVWRIALAVARGRGA